MRNSALMLVLIVACGAPGAAQTQADLDVLLTGVTTIAAPGIPGPLVVFGDTAFAVALWTGGGRDRAVVAAGRYGRGRVVGFGHGGYFGKDASDYGDTAKLIANCVRWASAGARSGGVLVEGLPALGARLSAAGLQLSDAKGAEWPAVLEQCAAVVADTERLTDEQTEALERFIERGGGFVGASLGWGWKQTHPGLRLDRDHRGNRLARKAGFLWADGYLGRMPPQGKSLDRLQAVHAGHALERLTRKSETRGKIEVKSISALSATVVEAVRALPPDDTAFLPRVRAAVARTPAKFPSEATPLEAADAFPRIALVLRHHDASLLPADKVPPAPDAATFPGVIPREIPRIKAAREVDTAIHGWKSLGLFASAGDVVTVEIPADAVGLGLRLRIGCHEDDLWGKDSWSRHPEITATFPLDRVSVRVSTTHGGLVYVDVPEDGAARVLEVRFSGVNEAPLFERGRTSPERWRSSLRNAPGPWAELATSKIILTLKSEHVRTLDDPETVLAFWDRVMDMYEELGREPLYRRPERIVTDVQIGAGYMHSGYPIMTHLDVGARIVDVAGLSKGTDGWGFWHELGHNRQREAWTFEGTGEVTNNLFSLYISEQVGGVKPWDTRQVRAKAARAREHIANGAPFEAWKSDPFLALRMYAEIQQAFGWDAYRRVFEDYARLPASERPKSDDEKRDQWLVRMSRSVGRDLSPFFRKWGVPVSDAAVKQAGVFPPWSGLDASESTPK